MWYGNRDFDMGCTDNELFGNEHYNYLTLSLQVLTIIIMDTTAIALPMAGSVFEA